jgi:hypothetical protein
MPWLLQLAIFVNDRFNGATDDRRNEASKKGSKKGRVGAVLI